MQQEHCQEQALVRPSSAEPLGEANCVPECPQGPAIPSHNPLDQVKTTELELSEDVVEERFTEVFRGVRRVEADVDAGRVRVSQHLIR